MSWNLVGERDGETAWDLEDLVGQSLRLFLPATVAVTWVWVSVVWHVAVSELGHAAMVMAIVAVAVGAAYRLHRQRLWLAVGVYLGGLTLAVTAVVITFESVACLYLYMLVVLVAGALTTPLATWGLALISALLLVGAGRMLPGVHPADLGLPAAFIFLAALTSSLGSQRLFTALGWALSVTRESQKHAEQAQRHRAELRRVLKSLDEAYARLERTNEALMLAQEETERAYRFKAEFVANVSHELRTPLHLIIGFSEMVVTAPESYGDQSLPSEYRGDIMAIYRSAKHLSDLVNDVLDLSQIEAGRLPLSMNLADLGDVIHEAAQIVRGLAEAKGLQLEVDLPADMPPLRLDRTRIRQVLLNLLTNAMRYTDAGRISVRVRLEAQEVQVSVEDTGRGIPADKLTRAFEAFSQLDEDRVREGSGLGLAVSRRFVEMHGGRMWIESALGKGTKVSFALPKPESARDSRPTCLTTGSPRSQGGQTSILVLHDDRRILTPLQRYLEGNRFHLASTVEQAREMIGQGVPAAVIMDAAWTELTPQLGLPPELPLITCPLPSMRRLGILLGATDFLTKPVTREDLAEALGRLPRPPRTILVVDDNTRVVRLLARMLKAHDRKIHVLEAYGGRQGLEVARSQWPDLVLLDLSMPDFDGYDFLEERTRDPLLAGMQVIIVSVRAIEDEAAPIQGQLQLQRGAGLSLTQVLRVLQAMVAVVKQPAATVPTSGERPSAPHSDRPAW